MAIRGRFGLTLFLCLVVIIRSASALACPSRDEFETLSDRLAESSLALAECRRDVGTLQAELDDLKTEVLRNQQHGCESAAVEPQTTAELDAVQQELAAAEELLQAAQEHLQEDEADFERDGRDLQALHRQLFATRAALLEARQRLKEQQTQLAPAAGATGGGGDICTCPADADAADAAEGAAGAEAGAAAAGTAGTCAAALLDLQACREDLLVLQEHGAAAAAASSAEDGCSLEKDLLAETRQRIAELAEERSQLAARLKKAMGEQGTCPPALNPCEACAACDNPPGSHVAPVPNTTPARHSRRAEMLQNQMLAEALGEVSALEEANTQLRNQIASLAWEGSTIGDLKASLAASQNRSAELSEELARTAGTLQLAREQVELLQRERDELKTSFSSSHVVATSCQARSGALMEAQKRVESTLLDTKKLLSEANAAADRRVAEAKEEAAQRLAAEKEAAAVRLAALQEDAAQRLAAAQADAAARVAALQEEAQRQAGEAAERRAVAVAEVQHRLEAAEAALESVERDKAELLAEKKAAEAAASVAERARGEAEVALAGAQAELRAVRDAKEAEVERLLHFLKAQEEAAREMQRANEMLRQAESGWLPLWLQRRWASSYQAAAAAAAALQARAVAAWSDATSRAAEAAGSAWQGVQAVAGERLRPVAAHVQQAVAQAGQAAEHAWSSSVRPALVQVLPSWPELEAAVSTRLAAASRQASAAAERVRSQAAAAKAAANAAVLTQLQRAPPALRLGPLATPAAASALVWTLLVCCTLPLALALALASARYLLFRLRPGTVRVATPGSSGGWARLEEALGYSFERHATLAAALDGDSAGGTSRYAWLGSALLRLLAAETAFKQQLEGAAPQALEAAADALAGGPALAARAAAATLPRLVLPGPGAKSRQLAADKAAQLYTACLGAAYVDSGFRLQAARKVFAAPASGVNGTAAAAAEDEGVRADE